MIHLSEAVARRTVGKYGTFPELPDVDKIEEFLDTKRFKRYVDDNLGIKTIILDKKEKCYTIGEDDKRPNNLHGTRQIRFRDGSYNVWVVASFFDKQGNVTGGFFGTIWWNPSSKSWDWQEETDWEKFRNRVIKHFSW